MELLLMGLVTAGALWLGACRPMAKVTLYRVETEAKHDEW
jgi:hypothetical protein